MKSNILTSRAMKLGIFSLTLALPALSAQAQAQKAKPTLSEFLGKQEEPDDDSREFDDTMEATKLYPSLDEMMKDERIFRPETGLDAEAVVRLRKRITDWEGKVEKLENEIKILENEIPRFKGNKGDKGNKKALEKKLRKRRSELASLEKRLDEYERKAQSEYDKLRNQPTQEQAAEIEKVFEKKEKGKKGNEVPFNPKYNPKYQGVPGSEPGKEVHRDETGESLKLR